ncbi:MAG TPA: hypothetical protein VI140_00115 [Oxalicibacterium sp.]
MKLSGGFCSRFFSLFLLQGKCLPLASDKTAAELFPDEELPQAESAGKIFLPAIV